MRKRILSGLAQVLMNNFDDLRAAMQKYEGQTKRLKDNIAYFSNEIVVVAKEEELLPCSHPDDPAGHPFWGHAL